MTITRAPRARRGVALPAALAAVCVLAALAALANFSARLAIREAAALHGEARAEADRETLRARASVATARIRRALLVAGPVAIGGADTVLQVSEVAWPWHRISVFAGGRAIIAEVARANAIPVWCAAIVAGGTVTSAPGALTLAVTSSCPSPVADVPVDTIASFSRSIERELVHAPITDTVIVSGFNADPLVIRAARYVAIGPGAVVTGVVVAPVVRVCAGGSVRGTVVASDTVVVEHAAGVVGDEVAAAAALASFARLRLLGRRGLLMPP